MQSRSDFSFEARPSELCATVDVNEQPMSYPMPTASPKFDRTLFYDCKGILCTEAVRIRIDNA